MISVTLSSMLVIKVSITYTNVSDKVHVLT